MRSPQLRPLLGALGAGVGAVLLDAAPAAAHAAGGSGDGGESDRRAWAVGLAFVALAALVGPVLARTGTVDRVRGALSRTAPLVVIALSGGIGLSWPARVIAFAATAAVALAPRGSPWRPAPAAVLLVVVTAGATGAMSIFDRTLGAVHVLAGATWLGLVIELAVRWHADPDSGRRVLGSTRGRALAALVVAGTTGTLLASDHLGDARLALDGWWGRGLAVKVALVVTAAVVGALLHREWAPKVEGSMLTAVAGIGLVLAIAGGPLSGALPTGPFLGTADGIDVLVAPLAPGPNTVLVRAGSEPDPGVLEVDGERLDLHPHGEGLWSAEVDLPEGRHRVTVGEETTEVTIRPAEGAAVVRASLPDRVGDLDCLDRLAGIAAAAARLSLGEREVRVQVVPGGTACGLVGAPAPPVDWNPSGLAAVEALQARRGPGYRLVVVADDDPRAAALVAAVSARHPGATVVGPDDPLVGSIGPTDLVLVAAGPAAAVPVAVGSPGTELEFAL